MQRPEPSATSIPWDVGAVRRRCSLGVPVYPGFWNTGIGFCQRVALSAQRPPLFLSSSHSPLLGLAPCSHQRYQNEIEMALQRGRALLAPALLFVPPVVPRSCDVKTAIQSGEKGNRGPSHISRPDRLLFLRHPELCLAGPRIPCLDDLVKRRKPNAGAQCCPKQAFRAEL